MFKSMILLAVIAVATATIATPLLGRYVPQPGFAPANTEHAGYLSGLTPLARQYYAYPSAYPSVYSGEHIPLAYANNYLSYSAPVEASSYQIAY